MPDEVQGTPKGDLAKRQHFDGTYVRSECPGCGAEVTKHLGIGSDGLCYPGMNGPPYEVYFSHDCDEFESYDWHVDIWIEVNVRLATSQEIKDNGRG